MFFQLNQNNSVDGRFIRRKKKDTETQLYTFQNDSYRMLKSRHRASITKLG
ncbi:13893_t:CDS:1, partial [Gigaspora rosea]